LFTFSLLPDRMRKIGGDNFERNENVFVGSRPSNALFVLNAPDEKGTHNYIVRTYFHDQRIDYVISFKIK
jgi:hypothetical protein